MDPMATTMKSTGPYANSRPAEDRAASGACLMSEEPADPFADACGLRGPLQLRLDGPEGSSALEFRRPFVVVGRDDPADVVIDRPEVSRRHAYFQVVAGRVFCVDLCSATGVHWDDRRRPVGWVDPGQGVGIGPARVRFEGVQAESTRRGDYLPTSRHFEWNNLPDARLEYLGPDARQESWLLNRVLQFVGRSSMCRVLLHEGDVGDIHAAILRTPDGIWAVDLDGQNRLTIDGVAADHARLVDGAEIGVGRHRLRVRIGSTAVRVLARNELVRRTPTPITPVVEARSLPPIPPLPPAPIRPVEDVPDLRVPADRLGLSELTASKLLDNFERMHQRTTEQFQQAILMMFRMHQDQMDMFRGELSRINRLEEEHNALRAEMARIAPATPPIPPLPALPGGFPVAPPSPIPQGFEPMAAEPLPPPVPQVLEARSVEAPDHKAPTIEPTAPPPTPSPSPIRVDRGSTDRTRPSTTPPPPRDARPPSDPDPHARIARRMKEIQDERQGLWKRILASMGSEGK